MEIKVQSIHFDADGKLLEFINQKVEKLETFHDHIVTTDVILKLERTGQVQDKVAELKVQVPGSVFVAKESTKTFEESIVNCTESIRRQLIKHKEKIRS